MFWKGRFLAKDFNSNVDLSSKEAIILFDQKGQILQANSFAKELFNLRNNPSDKLDFPKNIIEFNYQKFKNAKSCAKNGETEFIQFRYEDNSSKTISGKLYEISFNGTILYQTIFKSNLSSEVILGNYLDLIKRINSGNVDIGIIIDDVLKFIINQLGAAGCLVHIADFKKNYLYLSNSIGISSKAIRLLKKMRFSEGITGKIFNQEEVVFFPEIQNESWITKKLPLDILKRYHVKSYIGIPLIVDKGCIGVIGVVFTHKISPLDKDQKELLLTIAGNLGTLIFKSQIEARGNKFFHQLSILRELNSLWRQSKSFEDLLQKTANLVVERLQFWDLSFFQFIPEKSILKKVAIVGGMKNFIPNEYEQPISEGIIGWVVRHRKSKYVIDVRKEKLFIAVPECEIMSELAIPVQIGEKIFGVINMESRDLDAYDDIDIWTMETVAQNLALYLEHVQNLDKQNEQVENLQIINQISQFLNSIIDQTELQQKICDFLIETFDFPYVSIYSFNSNKSKLEKIYSVGGSNLQRPINSYIPLETGIMSWVAKNKKPYYAMDVSKSSIYFPISKEDQGSEYCLPILFGEELYGVVNIESNKINVLDKNQVIVIQTIIDHFSKTLRNAVLFSQINKEKEKTEAILSQMQEGVVITNSDDEIIYYNKTSVKYFPEIKSGEFKSPLPFYQVVKEKLSNGQQTSFEHEDGGKIWRTSAIRMKGSLSDENCLIIFENITEVKKNETEKIEHDRMEMAVQMAGSIAHELNQPLTGILGYCSLLMEDLNSDSEIFNDIKIIEEQAVRISSLVKKFQNLVRIKTKPYLGETEIIDLEKSGVLDNVKQ